MSLLFVFTNAFVVGLSGAVMPGPLLTVNISSALKKGFWAGPIVVLGHAIAELAVLFAIYFGLTKLVSEPRVFWWIAVIGGACLILMGAMMFADLIRKKVRLEFIGQTKRSHRATIVLAGLASISSPYWILWWLTVGALLISQSLQFGIGGAHGVLRRTYPLRPRLVFNCQLPDRGRQALLQQSDLSVSNRRLRAVLDCFGGLFHSLSPDWRLPRTPAEDRLNRIAPFALLRVLSVCRLLNPPEADSQEVR